MTAAPHPRAPTQPPQACLRSAFHELTMTLLGLFEVYGADPARGAHAADEIESLLRRHLGAPAGPAGARGKLALERLLDELEAARASAQSPRTAHRRTARRASAGDLDPLIARGSTTASTDRDCCGALLAGGARLSGVASAPSR